LRTQQRAKSQRQRISPAYTTKQTVRSVEGVRRDSFEKILRLVSGRGSQQGRTRTPDYSSGGARLLRMCLTGLPVSIYGEFDPGSGRTLAACLTHASRTVNRFRPGISGERVSNTWATCPALWDKPGKLGLIPDTTSCRMVGGGKFRRCRMGPRPISLLVG
jgi:hypothetical protein